MDNIKELVKKIVEANKAYRGGEAIITDAEYDSLLEELKKSIPADRYEAILNTLNEGVVEKNIDGKVKHPFIMGSLDKTKYENPEEVKTFIRDNIKTAMSVSAKVDGISSRAEYQYGKLVSLTTRGDGYFGQDCTSKAKYIKHLPKVLPRGFTGSIRGELVIFKKDFESIKDNYANPRNAAAGIMNRKDGDRKFNEDELRMISFVPYTILGDEYTKVEQFNLLVEMGFNVAENKVIYRKDIGDSIVDELFSIASQEHEYETDGLVICDVSYRNEDKYRPDCCKAFKTNQSQGVTTIIGFDWGTPSATGKMTPVALLEPIQLAGTTVKRVTCNNISFIEKMGIEIGKKVVVLKAGEIIPKIIEVLD